MFGSGSGRWYIFSIPSKGDSQEIPWGSENSKPVVKSKQGAIKDHFSYSENAFSSTSHSEAPSTELGGRSPAVQRQHLLPMSLAFAAQTASLMNSTDWEKFHFKEHSNQQESIRAKQMSTLNNVKSWANRDCNQIWGKMMLSYLHGSQAQGHQFLWLPMWGIRKWKSDHWRSELHHCHRIQVSQFILHPMTEEVQKTFWNLPPTPL